MNLPAGWKLDEAETPAAPALPEGWKLDAPAAPTAPALPAGWKVEPDAPTQGVLKDSAKRVGRSLVDTPGALTQSLGTLLDQAARVFRATDAAKEEAARIRTGEQTEYSGAPLREMAKASPKAKLVQDTGRQMRDSMRELYTGDFAPDPARDQNFTAAIADNVGPLAASLATPGGMLAKTATGMAMNSQAAADETAQTMKQRGATDEEANTEAARQFIYNLPAGALESVSWGRLFGRYGKALENAVSERFGKTVLQRILKATGEQLVIEGGEEGLQTLAQNTAAAATYDPGRNVTEGVGKAIALGAVMGGGLAGGVQTAAELANKLDTGRNKPERPADLAAQSAQLVKGDRAAQMFPLGTPELPLPAGMQRVETPRGVFHFDPRQITADEILTASKNGRENDVLGLGPYSKTDLDARIQGGEKPATLVERGPNGEELRGALVTPSTEADTRRELEKNKSDGSTIVREQLPETLAQREAPPETADLDALMREAAAATQARKDAAAKAAADREARQAAATAKRETFAGHLETARAALADPTDFARVQGVVTTLRDYTDDNSIGLNLEQRQAARAMLGQLTPVLDRLKAQQDAAAEARVTAAKQAEDEKRAAIKEEKRDLARQKDIDPATGTKRLESMTDDELVAEAERGNAAAFRVLEQRSTGSNEDVQRPDLATVLREVRLPATDDTLGAELDNLREFVNDPKVFKGTRQLDRLAETLRTQYGFSQIQTPNDVIEFAKRAFSGEVIKPDAPIDDIQFGRATTYEPTAEPPARPVMGPATADPTASKRRLADYVRSVGDWQRNIAAWAATVPDVLPFRDRKADNRTLLVSRNVNGGMPWRVTWFDNQQPTAHQEFPTKADAVRSAALTGDYSPETSFASSAAGTATLPAGWQIVESNDEAPTRAPATPAPQSAELTDFEARLRRIAPGLMLEYRALVGSLDDLRAAAPGNVVPPDVQAAHLGRSRILFFLQKNIRADKNGQLAPRLRRDILHEAAHSWLNTLDRDTRDDLVQRWEADKADPNGWHATQLANGVKFYAGMKTDWAEYWAERIAFENTKWAQRREGVGANRGLASQLAYEFRAWLQQVIEFLQQAFNRTNRYNVDFRMFLDDSRYSRPEPTANAGPGSAAPVPLAAGRAVQLPGGGTLTGPGVQAIRPTPDYATRAYHGTPHKVDKFTTAKIGTGEGAQAYGWGLYFAEDAGTASYYRDALSGAQPGNRVLINGVPLTRLMDNPTAGLVGQLLESTNGDINKAIEKAGYGDERAVFFMRKFQGSRVEITNVGNIYTTELLPDQAEFLDWDAPLIEQGEKVREVLLKLGYSPVVRDAQKLADLGLDDDSLGSAIYGTEVLKADGDMEAVSLKLLSLGIPGIRYLDAGSRAAGDGTRNFVIFDENLVKILEENGRPTFGRSQGTLGLDTPLGIQLPPTVKNLAAKWQDKTLSFESSLDKALYYAGGDGNTEERSRLVDTINEQTGLSAGQIATLARQLRAKIRPLTEGIAAGSTVRVTPQMETEVENLTGAQFARAENNLAPDSTRRDGPAMASGDGAAQQSSGSPQSGPYNAEGVELFRASTQPEAASGTHFTESKRSAEAYTDNPGFGGPNVYTYRVKMAAPLKLSQRNAADLRDLAKAVGKVRELDAEEIYNLEETWKSSGYGTVFHVLENARRVERDLAEKHDWIRFIDDFPAGSVTWKYLGNDTLNPNPTRTAGGAQSVEDINFARAEDPREAEKADLIAKLKKAEADMRADKIGADSWAWRYRDLLDTKFPGWDTAAPKPTPAAQPAGVESGPSVDETADPAADLERDAVPPPPREFTDRPGIYAEVEGHTQVREPWLERTKEGILDFLRGFRGSIPELPVFADDKSQQFLRLRQFVKLIKRGTPRVWKEASDSVGEIVQPLLKLGNLNPRSYERLAKFQARVRQLREDGRPIPPELTREIARLNTEIEAEPYGLFQKIALYLDLKWRVENLKDDQGNPITQPGSLNVQEINARLDQLKQVLAANPHKAAVMKALRDHQALVKQIGDDMRARELTLHEDFQNPFYFPHVVLEKNAGTLDRVKLDTAEDFRSYLIKPVGSAKPMETDYAKAMYYHLVAVGSHNLRSDLVRDYLKPYDKMKEVRDRAKELAKQYGRPVSWREAFASEYANKGFSLFYPDDKIPLSPEMAVSRDVLARRLGVILTAEPLQEQLQKLGLTGIKLLPEDIHQALAAGERETWVLPETVAEALNGVLRRETARSEGIAKLLGDASRMMQGTWKKWMLYAPQNYARYEYGNTLADLEKLFSADPEVFKRIPQAAREVRQFIEEGKGGRDVHEAFKLGVLDSVTAAEVNDLTALRQFEALSTPEQKAAQKVVARVSSAVFQAPLLATSAATKIYNIIRENGKKTQWQHGLGNASSMDLSKLREATFRYAKFKADLDRLRNNARPIYAGAYYRDIDAITDSRPGANDANYLKAAEISLATFGDYNNISTAGQFFRQHLVPFYSWMEINFKYHANLLRNLKDMTMAGDMSRTQAAQAGGRAAAAVASTFTRKAAASFMLRLALPYVAVMLWNNSGDREELEETLSAEDRRRFHIIVGKDADGKTMVIYANTALADVAKWFGGPDAARLAVDAAQGRTDPGTAFSEWLQKFPRDFANNLFQVGPAFRVPYTLMTGKSTFPDVTDQRTIPANEIKWAVLGQMTDQVTAELIRRAADKDYLASRDMGDWAQQLILQTRKRDPQQWAFYEIKDKAADFLEAKTGQNRDSSYNAPDQQVLRNFRRSIYRGDTESAVRFYNRLLEFGYTAERFKSSIRAQDPLSALPKDMRREFVDSLSRFEYAQLKRAFEFYARMTEQRGAEGALFPSERMGEAGRARYQPRNDRLRQEMSNAARLDDTALAARAEQELARSLRPAVR